MSNRDHNFEWATLLIHELVLMGARHFVLSPGARSAALALALAARDDIDVTIHFDERGAAFFALGLSKWTGSPAVLICTSGTAGGNYLPAVMEASNSETPLIVVTADRPAELHNTGANQTITQTGLFFDYTVWQHDLSCPEAGFDAESIRSLAGKAFSEALNRSGPVHLNAPFREPLVTNLSNSERAEKPLLSLPDLEVKPEQDFFDSLTAAVKNATRGVVAIGSMPANWNNGALVEFLEELNWPCFADISSQLRFAPGKSLPVLTAYDSYIRDEAWQAANAPDCVIRIGQTITSKYLEMYLARCSGEYFQLTRAQKNIDPEKAVTKKCCGRYGDIFSALPRLPVSESELAKPLLELEVIALDSLVSKQVDSQEAFVAAAITESRSARGFFLGNSLTIREADALVPVLEVQHRALANRGVSGIDGLVATSAGFAHALQGPVTSVIGDLSLLHDLNSLSLIARSKQPLVLIVVNNDGGLIFSKLPALKERAELVPFFQTPHGLTFEHAARQFKLAYDSVSTLKEFSAAYSKAVLSKESVLIEVDVRF